MIIVQLIPLLGFLVLSRHRVALIPVLIPFAAFTITELAGSWKGGKNIKIIMVLVILTGWSASPNNEDTVTLSKLDYGTIYNMYYLESLKKYSDKLEWREATLLLEDFIDSYEPRSLKNIKPFYICKHMKEAEVYLFFSQIHSLQSQALLQAGDTESATEEEQISSRLKEAGSINH